MELIKVNCTWSSRSYGQSARVYAASLAMVSSHMGLINSVKVVMWGEEYWLWLGGSSPHLFMVV
jgi:hypothetical protein